MASGQRFGRYRLLDRLGSGGQASVYRAVDPEMGRPVALKVLESGLASDEKQGLRLEREASLIASLDHPNIARILDIGEMDGLVFIAMEYLRENWRRLSRASKTAPSRMGLGPRRRAPGGAHGAAGRG